MASGFLFDDFANFSLPDILKGDAWDWNKLRND